MKTLGVIGGIGPESTIEYYRLLIRAYRARVPDGSNPPILINSIDMKYLVTLFEGDELAKVTDYLGAKDNRPAFNAGQARDPDFRPVRTVATPRAYSRVQGRPGKPLHTPRHRRRREKRLTER